MAQPPSDERAVRAQQAIKAADYKTAAALYTALEEDEPERGQWPQQLADLYRRTQQKQEELFALSRAADRYTRAGQQLKALVMLKRMLDLDADNVATRRRLASLHPAVSGKPGRAAPAISPPPLIELVPDPTPGSSASLPVFSSDELELAFEAQVLAPGVTPSAPENELLAASPLFAAIGAAGLAQILPRLELIELPAGATIFKKGDRGDSLYLIASGRVVVRLDDAQRSTVAELDEGEFFGEMAAFLREPRAATVEALTSCELVEIDRTALESLIQVDPSLQAALRWFLRDRLVDLLLRSSPLFAVFPPGERRRLIRRFRFLEAAPQAQLIEQGQPARGLVLILSGRVSVTRTFSDDEVPLAQLGPGAVIGEMGLLTGEPAIADVITNSTFLGLELPASEFRAMVAQYPKLLPTLESLADRRRLAFVEAVEQGSGEPEGFVPFS